MCWEKVLDALKLDTLSHARRTSTKHPGLLGWTIDGDKVEVDAEFEGVMKQRYETILESLESNGLEWRFDSRLLKKYVRSGKPDADILVSMLVCMKFLHEKTRYAEIKKTVHFTQRVHFEQMIRLQALSNFFANGGSVENTPKELQELWKAHITPVPPQ